MVIPPILDNKHTSMPSVFVPSALLLAALYTFARSAGVRVLGLANVINTMGQAGEDIEKGEADGTREAMAAFAVIIAAGGVVVRRGKRSSASRQSPLKPSKMTQGRHRPASERVGDFLVYCAQFA